MKHVALLILDMQETLLKAVPEGNEITKRCCFAVEVAHLLDLTCLYTEQSPEKLKSTHKNLLKAGLEGSECFSKQAFSAMEATGLEAFLEGRKIKHLLVGGIETGVCVYQTALGALQGGFEVTLLSDCVGGRREKDSRAVIASLQKTTCHWLPSETVFYSILGGADHQQFGEYNEFVKKYS